GGGLKQGREDFDSGGLAGAVGADETEAGPFLDGEVEIVQGDQLAVTLGQVDRLDHRHGGVLRWSGWGVGTVLVLIRNGRAATAGLPCRCFLWAGRPSLSRGTQVDDLPKGRPSEPW